MTYGRFAATALILALAAPAIAAEELPRPKAGLWESSVISGAASGVPTTGYKQCMDGKIDMQAMVRATGGMCDLQWKRVADDRIETETTCKMGPLKAKGKGSIVGDFNTKLRVESSTVVSMDEMPDGPKISLPNEAQTLVIEARWTGPCEPGQNPGDIVMPDGKVVRLPNMAQ